MQRILIGLLCLFVLSITLAGCRQQATGSTPPPDTYASMDAPSAPVTPIEEPEELEADAPQPEAPAAAKPAPAPDPPKATRGQTVYITNTGEKYHSDGCRHLRKSCIPISLVDAVNRGYTPCKVCRPPTL